MLIERRANVAVVATHGKGKFMAMSARWTLIYG